MGTFQRQLVAAIVAVFSILFLVAPAADAHSAVESSDPDSGAVIVTPVERVTIVFSDLAEPIGDGFVVVEADGKARTPDFWETEDGRTYVLYFDPPIGGGQAGMQWSIRSADSHALTGEFTFVVDADVADVTEAPETSDGEQANADPVAQEDETAAPGTTTAGDPPDTAIESAVVSVDETPEVMATHNLNGTASQRLVALIGRILDMTASLVTIGALVVLLRLLRGTSGEGRFVMMVARRAALVVAAGAVLELVAQVAVQGGGWSALLSPVEWIDVAASRFGAGVALRLIGAFGVATGGYFGREAIGYENRSTIKANMSQMGLLAAGSRSSSATNHPPLYNADEVGASLTPLLYRWHATSASSGAVLGVVALVAAAVVDGHTLSHDSPLIAAIVTVAHVIAGSVWLGGVIILFFLLRRRFRSYRSIEAVDLAVRYSVLATASLFVVAVAGFVLTYSRLDAISQLWTTSWGQLIVAKLALVGVTSLLGAVNHFALVPRLAARAEDVGLGRTLRNMVAAEAVVLVVVVALSAQLVATAI